MNSDQFFQHHYQDWVDKQGIYVIEQPLVSDKLGKRIFKLGMARQSLSTRIGDYRTAYSPFAPFLIHLIYEVPEKTGGKRANFALLTEQVAHATLKKNGNWSGGGEWYYSLDDIINVVSSLRQRHLKEIDFSKDWVYYSTHLSSKTVDVELEENIKSSLKGLIVMTDEERDARFNRGQGKPNYTGEKVTSSVKEPPKATKKQAPSRAPKAKDLIHDGTSASSYVGRRVKKYFEKTTKYEAGLYKGTVKSFFKKDTNKYPSFNILFDDGYEIPPVSSIQLLRLLIQ
jgi:hypothetical protein